MKTFVTWPYKCYCQYKNWLVLLFEMHYVYAITMNTGLTIYKI